MNRERTPAEAEAYGGSIDGIGKYNTYLANIQTIRRKTPQEFADEIGLKSVSEMLKEGGNHELYF